MAHFIECDHTGGKQPVAVNLDHVVVVKEVYETHSRYGETRVLLFYGADGKELGRSSRPAHYDIDELTTSVVPAAPGLNAYVVTVYESPGPDPQAFVESGRPTETEVHLERPFRKSTATIGVEVAPFSWTACRRAGDGSFRAVSLSASFAGYGPKW